MKRLLAGLALLMMALPAQAESRLIFSKNYQVDARVDYTTGLYESLAPGLTVDHVQIFATGRFCNIGVSEFLFTTGTRGSLYAGQAMTGGRYLIGAPLHALQINFRQSGFSNVSCRIDVYAETEDDITPPNPNDAIIASATELKEKAGLFSLDVASEPAYVSVEASAKELYGELKTFTATTRGTGDTDTIKLNFLDVEDRFNNMSRAFYRAHADGLSDYMLEQYTELRDGFRSLQAKVEEL